jgi:hypothetical protein
MGGYYVGIDLVEGGFGALLPGLVKGDAVNVLQDVNSGRRAADLKDGVRIVTEISGSQTGEGCAKGGKSAKHSFTVLDFGADKNIEILGCARLGVDANRVPPDDQVFNSVFVERA